ncbi:MAG TPA: hypothetical protein VEG25_08335 [Burkholderiales bacterium]|nr:hypothetical protein [Burkholderiales bacterium]
MKYLMIVFVVVVCITTMSFTSAQVIHGAGVASDTLMSDRDKIEKLRLDVAELQDKLAALNQKYNAHTHRLHLGITRYPRLIDCNVENVYGTVKKICIQTGNDYVGVLMAGSEKSLVTAPPGP